MFQRGLALFVASTTLSCVGPSRAEAPVCPPPPTFVMPPPITAQLGTMLQEIESLFGPRDHSYTLLGIEYSAPVPVIWFPGDRGDIVIALQQLAIADERRARFQLAHEAVHLLDPVVAQRITVLEEGLATYYQLNYIHREAPSYATGDAKYDAAAELATELMRACPGAVKGLRAQRIRISDITASELTAACVALSPEQAAALTKRFVVD